jgi:predicted amidohydrolase
MQVGFIQFKVLFGQKKENIEKVADFILKKKAELLVLPELFNSGYLFCSLRELHALAEPVPDGRTSRTLIQLARDHHVFIVAGLPERAGMNYYNSAILVGPNGFIGCYRKIHLFDTEKAFFSPGDRGFAVYDIGMAKIGMMICFDWIFPEAARTLALRGAEIICHPSNLVLPYCQKTMLTRSLENAVYSITANRIGTEQNEGKVLTFTGYSQIVSPKGEVLASAAHDEKTMTVDIAPLLARDKKITANNDRFGDRRSEFYEI